MYMLTSNFQISLFRQLFDNFMSLKLIIVVQGKGIMTYLVYFTFHRRHLIVTFWLIHITIK